MVDRCWGRIINVSSVNGSKGAFGQTNYAAAKAGMHGFTKSLSLEVAKKGVTVNTISPGYIGTKMVTAIPKEILDSKILPQIPVGRTMPAFAALMLVSDSSWNCLAARLRPSSKAEEAAMEDFHAAAATSAPGAFAASGSAPWGMAWLRREN